MITETFLRRPSGAGEWSADALRVLGVLSVLAGGIGWGFVEVAVFALTLLGMLVPRFLGVRPGFDIAVGGTLLVAAWSGVFELYTSIDWLDVVIHFAANGVLAALIFVVAARVGIVADVGDGAPGEIGTVAVIRPAVLTTVFGLAAGVLWEMGEWAGHTYIDSAIYVGYDDTIGDLAVGGLGSLLAGLCIRWLAADSRWPRASTEGAALKAIKHKRSAGSIGG
ncbi:hypothetical protein [Agreia sp. VKM Ac-1783]|uniref:hypothetical protein n=1 Tax=Agreia sp. VKM Ac-1783 TaxID=1938889 RepID=UPI000A2AED5A|nr:hypothetical protein [Agreia sp. VKM Ac-1783]SMQ58245.1 hypothetical protein SAMN06295943_0139 [Agreia sp. VKM Ac-1783]